MAISYLKAQNDEDLKQILALQQQNLYKNISPETQVKEGFVTVEHSLEKLQLMQSSLPQIIAKDNEKVVGYALVMSVALGEVIPELVSMFELFGQLSWNNRPINSYSYYVMGQICVAESHRGQGVFDGLYEAHKRLMSAQYELCITDVAIRNTRSMRAHERVGFEIIHRFEDALDIWDVIVWDWS